MLGEERDVGAALAERRYADVDDVQAVIEVLTEAAGSDLRLEVPVGRRDDPDVALDRAALADGGVLTLLEQAEELHLGGQRELADFVEEQRPALGRRDDSTTSRVGAGERAAGVPEELALDELERNRAAVDRDEGVVSPLARVVEGGHHELLARAALAGDEDRTRRAGDAVERVQNRANLGVEPDDLSPAREPERQAWQPTDRG